MDIKKKITKVYQKPDSDVYIYWETEDGEVSGAYNLMYETDEGIKTLKEILENQMKDYTE